MRRLVLLIGFMMAVLLPSVAIGGLTQEAKTQELDTRVRGADPSFREGAQQAFAGSEIIVKLDETASQSDLRELIGQTDACIEEDLPQDLSVSEAVQVYENSPDVEYTEPNFLLKPAAVPNDPSFSKIYALNNTGQTGGTADADIEAAEAGTPRWGALAWSLRS